MAYFATLVHFRVDTILLKNMPRWRADTIRPYTDGATELHLQMFVTAIVGAFAPTLFSHGENNREDTIFPYERPEITGAEIS